MKANKMSKSIVIRVKDSGAVCTFSLSNGIITPIESGGCDAAYVCFRSGAALTGTVEEILASVADAFNLDQCTVEGDLYPPELVETIDATIDCQVDLEED